MNKVRSTFVLIMFALILFGCGETEAQKAARAQTLDNDTAAIASCSYAGVREVSILSLSYADTSAICEKMAISIGRNPSVRALRRLSKAISIMETKGKVNDIADTAYQYMRVVESRGQLSNDQTMMNTINVVFKVYSGSEGRVTPKDLNILLGNIGAGAEKLSDDGIYKPAAMLSVQKQDAGQ
jgi:hypothetical protein